MVLYCDQAMICYHRYVKANQLGSFPSWASSVFLFHVFSFSIFFLMLFIYYYCFLSVLFYAFVIFISDEVESPGSLT